ncbi:hypothetical protein Tco_1536104 [Tanacetum coccineum]
MRNRTFMHTARDDRLLGVEPPNSRKSKKKSDSAISSEEYPSKKKSAKAKKVAATKPKPTKKKAPEATKRSKKDFHISQASGSGDGTDFQSRVPNEQHRKTLGTDEGTGTKLWVPDVPKYDFESEKDSWGDSGEEDDGDEDDTEEESDNDGNDDDGDDDDDDGDNDDNNDDSDHERTESDIDENLNLNQSNEEHKEEEEEEYVDEFTNEEDNADNAKEDMKKRWMMLRNYQHNISQESGFEYVEEDAHVTLTPIHDTQKTERPMQSSYLSSDFIDKLLNFENASPANNEIASLMDTTIRHEEPSRKTSFLYTVPVTAIPEITSILPQPFLHHIPHLILFHIK